MMKQTLQQKDSHKAFRKEAKKRGFAPYACRWMNDIDGNTWCVQGFPNDESKNHFAVDALGNVVEFSSISFDRS